MLVPPGYCRALPLGTPVTGETFRFRRRTSADTGSCDLGRLPGAGRRKSIVQAIAAPGHTAGHHIFKVASAGKSFVFLGDLTHHAVLLTENPRLEFAYDSDPKQAVQSRVRLLTMLAQEKTPVMSYHFAWPGFGNLAKAGEGFRYYPAPMQLIPV